MIKKRIQSIDALRGICITAMIFMNNPGNSKYTSPLLLHAPWNGITLADLFFPCFIFVMGMVIPVSFGKRMAKGQTKGQLIAHLLKRSAMLFLIGLFLNAFPCFDMQHVRILGVLQRIALVYFFSGLIFLFSSTMSMFIISAAILIGYYLLLRFVPVPGYGAGVFERTGNLIQYIDLKLLKGHLYTPDWDPEGLLSTLPAIASSLLGILTGCLLVSDKKNTNKLYIMLVCSALAFISSIITQKWFPLNKNLWSSSFVLFTTGFALLLLSVCYWLADINNLATLIKPFIIFGSNAILVYTLSEMMTKILGCVKVEVSSGTLIMLKEWLFENWFAQWAGNYAGSLLYSAAYTLLWFIPMAVLYYKKIFIKI
ncbi:acyltransferase family protein [Mahella australiensis]|uniref:Heparan-alpha-glucosaminide N-acetyltransferase n=1 Tax=Mahella australiensis (strain DSM 15567 / CIP 107919 / 50-1 BON) TaxID=697281 RepID=F4A0F0_MAHA5|nr:DUF5009 domain-containing protein [Mahella australiensis]AEE98011.1 Heparan-alpha-glucosaminide N-acetyltransferase [Mahella australiensis 50-1 BON]